MPPSVQAQHVEDKRPLAGDVLPILLGEVDVLQRTKEQTGSLFAACFVQRMTSDADETIVDPLNLTLRSRQENGLLSPKGNLSELMQFPTSIDLRLQPSGIEKHCSTQQHEHYDQRGSAGDQCELCSWIESAGGNADSVFRHDGERCGTQRCNGQKHRQ